MSLAASGGMSAGGAGSAGGGLMMAHQPQAMAAAMQQNQLPPGAEIPGSAGMGGAPTTIAALGADLADKSQLSLRQVKNVSHLPIVAVDMYASDPMVASFPPKPKDPDQSLQATLIGKFQAQVSFQPNETAHKTLRKYLSKDKSYDDLRKAALATPSTKDAVTIVKPHHWLGMRRLQDVPEYINASNPVTKESDDGSGAIAEEASQDSVHVTNGTLDGVSAPAGDDFDRVVYKLRLASSKKAVTILPEEANSLILTVAQTSVARTTIIEDDPTDFPLAIALPAWACHDTCLEAWMDSVQGAVFVQRSVAALCGTMQPGSSEKTPNKLLDRISTVTQALQKAHQKANDGTHFEFEPLVVLVGITSDGLECTAVQVSDVQNQIPSCLFGNYKVHCNVSCPTQDPMSKIEQCLTELYQQLDEVAPEVDGPIAFVPYATNKEQLAGVSKKLEKFKTRLESWEEAPVIPSRLDCVAIGTAVLGAVTHGRIATLITGLNNKPKVALAMRIRNVAPTAVGIKMSYKKDVWTPVKTIFDFDRCVPAGPYEIELSAAQCAAMLEVGAGDKLKWESKALNEAVEKALKDSIEGNQGIPKREAAALEFKIQVVQKMTREGEWTNVGDLTMPLIKVDESGDKEKQIGCERISLELSVNSTGVITQSLVGHLESVVQAVVSSRNSKLRYWIGILLAILFFGGFLVKSYWEEAVFEHDTKRLLAYYKHVMPGTMSDGDLQNARYLVWKYRGKKNKLWKRLEKKYEVAVRHEHEWEGYVVEGQEAEEEEEQNLDEEDEKEEPASKEEATEEPDL
mmetsp:Transcript_32140/g.53103  ORF Transcript_32140/g.53103 Transcript_32140/m.53103 type:complete len:799 (-) Transcript_32140:40-2436(-)|eukprot:CAMPEP_0119018416 /NCGR_PEP_ID=MMETSP1176-20130426/19348_1 /TAXON_ID=265551 /ORGANISM="Synedropsis recta cf, Strain CCMP1620" /LENGTH=798 /DNA_ID=CAMNT_0006972415 /DNA_START=94 /DNA_END=2493 /DNA_ORIENTATION=-